jgi:uncharacterized membrane protein
VNRLPFVDWTRGLAVLAMVLWHSGDAWLRPGLKNGEGFFFLRFFGGLAAPSFLLLAGLAAALAVRPSNDTKAAREQLRASAGRGIEVIVFGYALRLQSWLIDADAVRKLYTLRGWLPIALGYVALLMASRKLAKEPRRASLYGALGLLLTLAGMLQVESIAPGRLARLLQVDVLQAIGASLVVLALAQHVLDAYSHPRWLLLAGVVTALSTAGVWSLLPGMLPVPIAAYLGRFSVAEGAPAPALFPLFPWLSYALVGAALGRFWRLSGERIELSVVLTSLAGALLAALTTEAHPWTQEWLSHAPQALPPMRVAFRVGLVTCLLGAGFACARGALSRALEDFGRASLRINWVHLLVADGLLGSAVRARLGYGAWAALASVLLVAMWGLSRARLPSSPPAHRGQHGQMPPKPIDRA